MGGALIQGWLKAQAFAGADLIVVDPEPGLAALEAEAEGALLNPAEGEYRRAQTVVLGVKPQMWRDAAGELAPLISPDAVIVSFVAGVRSTDIAKRLGGRPVAPVMP